MKPFALIIGVVSALGATAVMAQTMVEDTDGDGNYSYEEMVAAYPDLTQEAFDEADANGDGALDASELASAQEGGLIPM